MSNDINPLINPPQNQNGAPPLDLVKAEHFLPAIQEQLTKARQEIDAIKNNTDEPTFENTVEALEFSGRDFSRTLSVFSHLAGANTNDDITSIEEKVYEQAVKYSNDISMDADLFKRIKAVYDKKDSLNLTAEQKMLLEESYKGFVRSGAELNDADKLELRDINERLSKLSTQFKNNTVNATKAYKKVITDEKDLAGVPERAKNMYRQMAKQTGEKAEFVILLSPPPMDIFSYAESRELRKEIYDAYSNIGFEGKNDNRNIVLETVKLRHRRAQLLGHKTHADFVLDDRMAKTPKAVMDFLKGNEAVYKPSAEKHLQAVKDFAKAEDGITDFKSYDYSYYNRQLKEKTFNMDLEKLRPYFDLEKVLEGVRAHAEKLFNLDIIDAKGKYPTYSDDVKVYEIKDKKTGELKALFYADYYARAGAKRNGAWMSDFRGRGRGENGQSEVPHIINVCNFPKPTPEQPTLLSFDEVTTLFHEFGHGLHGILAKGEYPSLTGTNVKWDFVELPSQLQENWVKEKEVLDTFAKHFKTGEALPAELIQKMKDMENFGAGYGGLRQTYQALLDMKWHTTDPATINSVEELEDEAIKDHWLFPREGGCLSTKFGHLFAGGYSAGYYSYKWAEVLDADVFEAFKKKGLYDRELADKLLELYSKGGTVDPMKLYVDMMGREPDQNALLRREGLKPANNNKKDLGNDKKPASPKK